MPRGLLTDEAAYRSMATAKNPYGDGHAAERIVERIRRYFASQAVQDEPKGADVIRLRRVGESAGIQDAMRPAAVVGS